MKTVLVMGAGGFIGKSLCKELSQKVKVRAFDVYDIEEFADIDNIEMVIGNFVSDQDFSDILYGVDEVFHLISTTLPTEDTSNIPREIEQNIIPTVRLLESMVKNNIKDIIFASSGGTIYGETGNHMNYVTDPLNPICSYGVQKKVIESYLQFYGLKYGINYKIARISNPYGLGQNPNKPQGVIPIFINRLLNNQDITIYGDGTNERDYIYMDDLIEALIKLSVYKGTSDIFNIGFGQAHSLKEIVEIIERLSKKKFKNINYQPMRNCDVSKTILEVKPSQELLNWEPKIEMEQGIGMILNCFKNNTNLK